MPFYTYKCKCGHETEQLRLMKNRNKPLDCSECKTKESMERVLECGNVGFKFVGDGFYANYKQERDARKELKQIKEDMKKNE